MRSYNNVQAPKPPAAQACAQISAPTSFTAAPAQHHRVSVQEPPAVAVYVPTFAQTRITAADALVNATAPSQPAATACAPISELILITVAGVRRSRAWELARRVALASVRI
ncbi:hypothetical protein N7475_004243 [Penicillium sp. IBT 31633x]|nr:hypothetical protein N7475_004243 [Penicillium sp. IBT 31633x]